MQANDFDDLFAQQLGRLPAPDFSERDWREVENRLVINRLQRKLTALTWALPLLGAVSLAMAGGLYHQLRQAHREIEELKKTTAAVVRRAPVGSTAPQPVAPRPRPEAFGTLTHTAATTAPTTGQPVAESTVGAVPRLPAPAPTSIRRAPAAYPAQQPPRSISQPTTASASTSTPPRVETFRVDPARPVGTPSPFSADVAVKTNPSAPESRTMAPPAAPEAPRQLPDGNAPAHQPGRGDGREAPGRNRAGTEPGREKAPSGRNRGDLVPAGATGRTTWGENLTELPTLPARPLALAMDTTSYRGPLILAARRTVRYAPVETKGEIRRTGQPAPLRLSGLLDATSVGLHLGVPTGWGRGLSAGRGSVLGGQVAVRLTPRWQVFADVSSQRISPESDPRRFLKGIPVVRFADPNLDFVGMRVNDLSLLNVGAGVNFVVTDRFRLKPYLGLGYNLQVPRRYDVSYAFIKRPHRWPPQFPPDKEERVVSLRDRFEAQQARAGQFRLQGGVRYPIQPNLNLSLEGFLNTQFRRLPSLTDTGGLRVGLAYEF